MEQEKEVVESANKQKQGVQWTTSVCLFQKQASSGVLANSFSENLVNAVVLEREL